MEQNKILIIGSKESFIIRVLLKKLADADIDAKFVTPKLDLIHDLWDETALVTFYMEPDDRLEDDVRTFLVDRMEDDDKQI